MLDLEGKDWFDYIDCFMDNILGSGISAYSGHEFYAPPIKFFLTFHFYAVVRCFSEKPWALNSDF